jgi:hypothetical protein
VQSDEVIRDFLKRLLPFNLTKGEKLMLLNNRPVTESVLVSMIEECEERFSEEQRTELLGIVAELPEPPSAEEEEGADGEMVDGGADIEMGGDDQEGAWDGEDAEFVANDDFVTEKDQVNSEGEGD